MMINSERLKIWNDPVVVFLKVLSRNSPLETKVNRDSELTQSRFEPSDYEAGKSKHRECLRIEC